MPPEDPRTIHGRGAADNPANRFERLAYEPDPEAFDPSAPAPPTQMFRDTARSIIVFNDSPDIGFSASLNPYRGCEHGCAYCLAGDTLILMGDGHTRKLADIRRGDEIYGTLRKGWYRRYVRTQVLDSWEVCKPAYRVTLADGTTIVAGGDHRFLTERGWKFVARSEQSGLQRPTLTTNNKLMGTGSFIGSAAPAKEYRQGYLSGLIRGDGLLASYLYQRQRRALGTVYPAPIHQFRLALVDGEALDRAENYLHEFGIVVCRFLFQKAVGARKPLPAIQTSAQGQVEWIRQLIAWPATGTDEWYRGFLAGLFDAEGSYSAGVLRISNTDPTIIDHFVRGLERFGFSWVVETPRLPSGRRPMQVIRIMGGLRQHLRFFHAVQAAISRKRDLSGQAVKSTADLQVRSIEKISNSLPLFDLTTGTGDFIANGLVSHNCYARPTHEYLGFSAGLDFETKILVKEDAPKLLRQELLSPKWQPQTVTLSGVTDCYQPIERKLQLTRRCLEVLAEFRNPVAIVTKSSLVTRDVELLAELARFDAALVFLSITTLDPELAGKLEPRAARPAARLEALRVLSAAGIPVGVMTAPLIPGLNDHEVPAILAAAAAAGARSAGYVPLRLPHGLGPLFADWLERHYPQRKDKVLGRLRELRGGRLNDPNFGSRMRGQGPFAAVLKSLFELGCKQAGLTGGVQLSTAAFRRPGEQRGLFD